MVEAPIQHHKNPDRKKDDLETRLRTQIAEYVTRPEYANIPNKLKRIATEVALKALLMPREKLFIEIEILDEQAARAPKKSAARYDRKTNNPLTQRRFEEADRIHKMYGQNLVDQEKALADTQLSALMTKLDRKLIATRKVKIKLAEQYKEMEASTVFKKPKFRAAHNLCMDIVFDQFKHLPLYLRQDPTIPHSDQNKSFAEFLEMVQTDSRGE